MASEIPLEYGCYYHIFNRGINRCKLFFDWQNYMHFLYLYKRYIPLVAETFSYCLIGNHFHILLRIKDEHEIFATKNLSEIKQPDRFKITHRPSRQLSNLFSAYAKCFNKEYQRSGSLFERPFHRKKVEDDQYLRYLVYYIHHNPVHHGIVSRMEDWTWSSYNTISNGKRSIIEKDSVIEWFDDMENFNYFHKHQHNLDMLSDLIDE